MPPSADAGSLPPTLVAAFADRYTLERELGRGGMATVYLARDLRHDRRVAIKLLAPEVAAGLGVERFQAEIRVTAALQHPHLLPLFDSGAVGNELFYVMPYVQGETLRERITSSGPLPVAEAVRLVRTVGEALQHAHDRHVVHRDLKPENILLQDGQPIVADFGIALAASGSGTRLTQTGLAVGTPLYMSPEQATGDRTLDARSDQFSLAAIAYELLTGASPHAGSTAAAVLTRILTEAPRPVRAVRADVPDAISAAIDRALAKEPADRFPSMRAFVEALETPAPRAMGMPATQRARSRTRIGIAAIAALAVIGAVFTWRGRSAVPAPTHSVDARRVFVAHVAGAGEPSLATLVDDALAERLAQLPWVSVTTATAAVADEAAAVAAATSAQAGVVALTTVLGGGANAQLRLRLLDATSGALIRALPPVALDASPTPVALRNAVEPLVVATGFATAPTLGPVTVPADHLPSISALRDLASALDGIDAVAASFERRQRAIAQLERVVRADSVFLQAKLWLAWLGSNNYVRVRGAGGAALADTIRRWGDEAEATGTRYEAALGRVIRSSMSENGDAVLDPIRALLRLHPTSPLQPVLPRRLLGLNRIHEALRVKYAYWTERLAADSTNPQAQAEFWNQVAYDWHYLGQYDSALVAARRARALRPSAGLFMATELQQFAALGLLDSVRARVPEVEAAAQDGFTFGFAGETYLSTANELSAHGHTAEGRAMAERALAWFDRREADVARNASVGLRRALTLLALDRPAEAEAQLRRSVTVAPTDVRIQGALGRALVRQGRQAEADRIAASLAQLSGGLQGQPTYERATIAVQRGSTSWGEAVSLLEQAIREGQDYTLLRRLHAFTDWQPLKDHAPFKRVITPVDTP
ncbi:MAG: protein kinase [Gemmatimonadaceae bacterium]|jgi:tetratricopeptide (TPR) repeat protein|nr:protein kinase [Gemmatimonadaceae bacterium]